MFSTTRCPVIEYYYSGIGCTSVPIIYFTWNYLLIVNDAISTTVNNNWQGIVYEYERKFSFLIQLTYS